MIGVFIPYLCEWHVCYYLMQVGDLGNVVVGPNGRTEFRLQSTDLKVWDVIGRSIVLHRTTANTNVSERYSFNSNHFFY